jgi:hypothetical protein
MTRALSVLSHAKHPKAKDLPPGGLWSRGQRGQPLRKVSSARMRACACVICTSGECLTTMTTTSREAANRAFSCGHLRRWRGDHGVTTGDHGAAWEATARPRPHGAECGSAVRGVAMASCRRRAPRRSRPAPSAPPGHRPGVANLPSAPLAAPPRKPTAPRQLAAFLDARADAREVAECPRRNASTVEVPDEHVEPAPRA